MVMKSKCSATGQLIRWSRSEVVEVGEVKKVKCPKCGKVVKPKFAYGGHDGWINDRPRYFYLPYHKVA
jgi:NAD-dependent SIR2 family protein deacetylase